MAHFLRQVKRFFVLWMCVLSVFVNANDLKFVQKDWPFYLSKCSEPRNFIKSEPYDFIYCQDEFQGYSMVIGF